MILSLYEAGASLNTLEVKRTESYPENFSTDKYLKPKELFRKVNQRALGQTQDGLI